MGEWLLRTLARFLNPARVRSYPLVLVGIFIASWLQVAISGKSGIGGDFVSFYTAGRFFLSGHVSEIYSPQKQRGFQHSVVPSLGKGAVSSFANPPFAVVLYAPFAVASYNTGVFLWWSFGGLLLFASVWLLWRELPGLRVRSLWLLFGACFFFYPTCAWLMFGQSSTLSLFFCALSFVFLRRGRDFEGGLALGLLAYKPQLALVVASVLLFRWRWRALLGGFAGLMLWLGVGLLISPSLLWSYVEKSQELFAMLRNPSYNTWTLHSFYGFSILLFDRLWPKGVALLTVLLSISCMGWLFYLWRRIEWRPKERAWELQMAATFALGLLISPHLCIYDLTLLLLPLGIVLGQYPEGTSGRDLDGGALLVWTGLLYLATLFSGHLTQYQTALCEEWGLPKIALQVSVPVLLGWVVVVTKRATLTLPDERAKKET